MPKIPKLHWWIGGLLFLASVLNYLDRQTLSILAPTIQKDLHIDDSGYAAIVNAFLCAYTISYLISGRITDWLGARIGMSIFIAWWSLSNMLAFFARSTASLGASRFLLGLGEAGGYTVAPKAVSEWFTPAQRGIAIGLVTLGATVGATLAPQLVVSIAGHYGWRMTFVLTGALGLAWIVPWFCLYRKPTPQTHTQSSAQPAGIENRSATATATTAPGQDSGTATTTPWTWKRIVCTREVWALMLARMLTDPVWYFYQFWFSKYLFSSRGVLQKELAITWVIFLAADIGTIIGGLGSGWLIRRGAHPAASRIKVMALCACLLPLSALVPVVVPLWIVLTLGMIAVFAHMCWLVNLSSLVVDLIPRRSIGTVFGIIATGSSLGGIGMNTLVGHLVSHYSYAPWFTAMAFLHPIAWVIIWKMIRGNHTGFENIPAASAA